MMKPSTDPISTKNPNWSKATSKTGWDLDFFSFLKPLAIQLIKLLSQRKIKNSYMLGIKSPQNFELRL